MGNIRVDPDHLDRYVEASQQLNDTLRARVEQLITTHDAVVPEFQWGYVDATSALQALVQYVQLNDADDAWVSVIAQAFRELDAHFPAGVPESIIEELLAAHGLDGGRQEVTFDDPSAVGLPLTSGWANDPVATATGHLAEVEVDLTMPESAGPLRMPRVYSSRFRRPGAFGRGWSSWLDVGLELGADGAVVTFPDGRRVPYADVAGRFTTTVPCRATLTRTDDGFALAHPDGDRWDLDADGRLRTVRFGRHRIEVERDADALIVGLRHSSGRSLEVDWLQGRVAAVRASDGRQVSYVYDANGDLVAVDGPTGHRRFELGEDGLILAAWDPDGVLSFRNTYDDEGRVTTQESSFGRTTRFSYLRPGVTIVDDTDGGPRTTFIHDAAGRLVGVIDDAGAHQTTRYDGAGNAIASMDRDGAVTTRVFDEAGRPVRIEGPDGAVVQIAYDEVGRIVGRIGPDGSEVRLAYEGDAREPVRVTDPLGAVTTCELDAHGEIVAVTDPDGVTTRLERDADGVVTAVEAGDGARMTLELDATGHVVGVTAADGSTTRFTRDAAGHVTSRTTPDGATTRWERTAAGRVAGVTSPAGAVSTLGYGDHGELTEVVDPTGVRLAYEWDVLGQLTRIVDPNGAAIEHRYDGLSRLIGLTDPTGRTWRREYDPVGRITATVEPDGSRTTRTYDAAGRLTELTDQLGATTRFAYDAAGRVVSVVDPLGDEATFTYDSAGQRTQAVDADGNTMRWSWTPGGRLAETVTQPADDAWPGQVERFTYDAAGRLASVVVRTTDEDDDAGGQRLELVRDEAGEVVALAGADGRRVALVRDERGRVVGTDDGTGPGWRTEFDHAGRPLTVTGPDGATSSFGYDAAGRLDQVTDPAGGVTRFERDAAGLLTGATDPAGGTQRYEYDDAGRMVAFTDALGRRTEVLRDDNGRGAGHTSADGGTQRLQRDAAGRVVGVTDASGRQVRVELDPAGRPLTIADDDHRVEFAYDAAGRLARRTVDGRSHAYAREGRRFTVTDPEGAATVYERDRAGRVVAIEHPVAGRATLTRDAKGRPLRLVAPQLERRWSWDEAGQLVELEQTVGETTTRQSVERDTAGRIAAITDEGGTTRLGYDLAGQLTELQLPDGRSWAFAYEHGRRVSEVGPDGTERRFRYDPAGQLVAIEAADGTTRLAYDDLGRRVRRDEPGGSRTRYGWGAGGRLSAVERTAPDGTATTVRLTVDPSGDPIAIDGVDLDWDHATGLPVLGRAGRTALLAGGAAKVESGSARWRALDPFGASTSLDLVTSLGLAPGDEQLAGPVGLGARGEVTFEGLVWLRARVYDPDTGVFLSPDPLPPVLGGGQVANPYHYATNDPIHHIDPWGLQPLTDADLAAYNDQADRGLHTRFADGVGNFAADPFGWVQDNWDTIAAVGLIVVGTVMVATGVGAPIGAGLLVGAGTSIAGQIAFTGEVDSRQVWQSSLVGAAGGGAAMATTGLRLSTQVAIGAGVDGVGSAGVQYANTGRVDPAALAFDVVVSAGVTTGISAVRSARHVDVVPTMSALDEAMPTPRTLPAGADPSSETAVIGRQWDTAVARDWPGHEVLDIPNWSPAANDAWIDSVIERQLPVYIASPETKLNLFDVVNDRPTMFGRELEQLRSAGYVPVDDVGHVLVPGGG